MKILNQRGDISLIFAGILGIVLISAAGYFAYLAFDKNSGKTAKTAATPTATPYAGAARSDFAAATQVMRFYEDYNLSRDQAVAKKNIDPAYYNSAISNSSASDPILCGSKSTEPYRPKIISSDSNAVHIRVKQHYVTPAGEVLDNHIDVDLRRSDMLITKITCVATAVPL